MIRVLIKNNIYIADLLINKLINLLIYRARLSYVDKYCVFKLMLSPSLLLKLNFHM
jgi:hypothetical protein